MKNKGLIITLIVLLVIIIIGLVGVLVVTLNGGMNITNGFLNFGRHSSEVILDEAYNSKEIKNIEILSDAGDVAFEKSTEENVRVVAYGINSNDIKIDLNEGNLKVDYTKYSRSWISFGGYLNDITVYVPEAYSGEINIKNDYGNCTAVDLENATINVDSDAGNIELGKVKNATIKCDYGNVDIKAILNKCNIKSDCGNIEIEKAYIQENSSIECDYGNIKIKETNDICVDANTDLGKTEVNYNNRQSTITLKIKADCGDIRVGE